MNFLMLRGQVPQDRDAQEIVFDSLGEMDDMWTLLFHGMLKGDDFGELLYWGGTREKWFASNFVERWVPSLAPEIVRAAPDVIFCRGGFKQYVNILRAFPNAFKIYYGAGKRFIPQDGYLDYDMLLQDSPTQLKYATREVPDVKSVLFFKPSPDNLFHYDDGITKSYDVCYPADGRPDRKGHEFIYNTVPEDLSMINLGFPSPRCKPPKNVMSYRVLKTDLWKHMNKCVVGIVASTKGTGLFGLSYDSCPRIVPEMLACDLPIVVLDELEFWVDKYITPMTGKIANRENFWDTVRDVLANRDQYSPREYYLDNLTVKHASAYLRMKIDENRI